MSTGKWLNKPAESEWPTFILDMDTWTIRLFKECEPNFDTPAGWNYSAISYAWGPWHDKRDQTGSKWHDSAKEPAYPAFAPSVAKVCPPWKFPIVNKNYVQGERGPVFQDPVEPIFTIEEMRKTLGSLGTRYVWWDWACIPQGPNDILFPDGQLPNTHGLVQMLEVDKMRIVYPCSMNGCLWLHQTSWVRDPAKGIKGSVQLLLELVNNLVINQYAYTPDAVEAFCDLLVAAQNTQASLISVWSFQEAVLFGAQRRPQKIGSTTAVILDHSGAAFGRNEDSLVGLQGGKGDFVADIVNVASRIIVVIADTLIMKENGKKPEASATAFTKWCFAEDRKARDLMSRLIATGCVGYFHNSPMTLLESKWTRTLKCPWNSKIDRTIRAVIGAMDVDLPAAALQAAAAAKAAAVAKALTAKVAKWDADAAGAEAEYQALVAPYIDALVQAYQWRLLLHARGKEAPAPAPAAGTVAPAPKAWWPRFADIRKPPFASLEYYIGTTKLDDLYQPRTPRPATLPADVFDLPLLEVAKKDAAPLLAKKKDAYKYYDMTKASAAGWASCVFYAFKPATPDALPDALVDARDFPHQPGTVGFANVAFKDAPAALGKGLLLLPFEKFTDYKVSALVMGQFGTAPLPAFAGAAGAPASAVDKIRCFVLSDFDPAARTATFRGVADFSGLKPADMVALDKDLELW